MKTTQSHYIFRLFALSINFLFFSFSGFSQGSIAAWDFAGLGGQASVAPSSSNSNATFSNVTFGPGLTASNYLGNGFTASKQTTTTLAAAITDGEYIQFTITPSVGKTLIVSSIDLKCVSQNFLRTFSLLSSVNGFLEADEIGNVTSNSPSGAPAQAITVTGHSEITTAVTFRIYIYGRANQYEGVGLGNSDGSDLVINGSVSAPDVDPPTMPGTLNATSVGATSLRLNWTPSTDDNGVTGYDVYNGLTLLGSTTSALFYSVGGLTAETNYTFKVIARDLSGKSSTPATVSVSTAVAGTLGDVPKLPIGMNVPGFAYYTTSLPFTDAMTMSGGFMSFYDGGGFSSTTMSEIPRDVNGYPTQIPYQTSDGKQTKVRTMMNSNYNGRYVLTFDGAGTIEIGGITNQKVSSNKYYIDFTGIYNNAWINILTSVNGNHLKNFKILPLMYENSSTYPTFNEKFLDGLRPFHALRFMDWIGTNNSKLQLWNNRPTKTYYSQSTELGACYEYAIELANELDVDAWVTIPHLADDNFITQAARLWRDGLRANRKVYTEYSNEIWNWQFTQAGYCLNNAPNHPNAYVSAALAAISATGDHPEKDAYMMARTFRLWKAEYSGANAARLVRVAAVQHGWMDNTKRILNYLFDVDKAGCDVVSPGGYFNFTGADHNGWLARCGTTNPVTPAEVCQAASTAYDTNESAWTDKTAEYTNARGLGYVVYEGGQHMQPYMQGDHCYNQAVWDAQIHPKMYDLYMQNFRKMIEPNVNCTLFMAFAFMGKRESKYGSWGHLENMAQIGSVSNYMTIAPKFQALLDANTPKTAGLTTSVSKNMFAVNGLVLYPNPASEMLNINFGKEMNNAQLGVFDTQGRQLLSHTVNGSIEHLNIQGLKKGIYILKVLDGNENKVIRFVKE